MGRDIKTRSRNELVKTSYESFSWFQKLTFFFLMTVFLLSGVQREARGFDFSSIGFIVGYVTLPGVITFLLMRAYNKKYRTKGLTKNFVLKKIWKVARIVIACLIVLWYLMALYGFAIAMGW